MQKGSSHNVAVIRLRIFSYSTVGGSRYLYPLRVSTVRQTSLRLYSFMSEPLFFPPFCGLLSLSDSPQTILECMCYSTWAKVESSAVCFCVLMVVRAWLSSSISCISFPSCGYLMFPLTRLTCCWHLSSFTPIAGEEREEWRYARGCPSAQPFFSFTQHKVFLLTNSFAPDLRDEKPQSRGDGNLSHSSDSPRHPRRCVPPQPSQCQPLWQHGGPQQVSVWWKHMHKFEMLSFASFSAQTWIIVILWPICIVVVEQMMYLHELVDASEKNAFLEILRNLHFSGFLYLIGKMQLT